MYSAKLRRRRLANELGFRFFCDGNRGFWLRCNARRVLCDGECQRVYCDGSKGFFATAREVFCDGERIVKVFCDGQRRSTNSESFLRREVEFFASVEGFFATGSGKTGIATTTACTATSSATRSSSSSSSTSSTSSTSSSSSS